MVKAYNTESVKSMDDATRERIIAAGIPIECYTEGKIHLGSITKSSITRYASINTLITQYGLPFPPSLYYEYIAGICTDKSDKQDFREIIDGKPGAGKSYSGMSGCIRYAQEAARLNG